ncbi:MAG: DNA methylase [Eubacteriales bacterium]|jgi:DNA polymerase V
MEKERAHVYAAIDLKSFYASVECRERGLDPLTTNLVVADKTRTEKTICLAVSPSLKAEGIPGRPRLFEVVQAVGRINQGRLARAGIRDFEGSSFNSEELKANPRLKLDYVTAPPRMKLYMDYSSEIYHTYLKFVAPEDIFPYSIDEVFIELTSYLKVYGMTAEELTGTMVRAVLEKTGITATAGVGTNMYLAKVAMDVVAKHIPADENGVRIASCDEMSYRRKLWNHRPITDFWRVGPGYARKLKAHGIETIGDVARTSIENEELLYHLFGVNAELLIDHAWGWEPCTMADVKRFRPPAKSMSQGQVLQCAYDFKKARLVVSEMADRLALDLVEKNREASQIVLTVGYDVENLLDPERRKAYRGEVVRDRYGRLIPKQAHGTINLGGMTSSETRIRKAATELFDRIADPSLLVRRMYVVANHVADAGVEGTASQRSGEIGASGNGRGNSGDNRRDQKGGPAAAGRVSDKNVTYEQLDLFTDYQARDEARAEEKKALEREKKVEKAVVDLQHKFGKNAVVKGMNLEDGATGIMRNKQIGGHRE